MSYLLAKYALLFLLTAFVAFLLGHWWARRRLIDVTDSYHSLTRTLDSSNRGWERLWSRLDGLDGSVSSTLKSQIAGIPTPTFPKTDLSGVESKLAALEARIDNIPTPAEPDLGPLTSRIDTVAQSVAALPKPHATDLSGVEGKLAAFEAALMSLPVPQPTDLEPVLERVSGLESAIGAIRMPEGVDLAPLASRMDAVERAVQAIPEPQLPEPVNLAPVHSEIAGLRNQVESLSFPSTDLNPVQARIGSLETLVRNLEFPSPKDVDLAPVQSRLAAVEAALRSVPTIETHAAPDLSPFNQRLTSLEEAIKSLALTLQEKPKPAAASGPRLLTSAEYGEPDDLKLISGVGPKLEKLLHKNGVYYFWQIASWSHADVEFVDAQLDVFTGRIARDDWVSQANALQKSPGAAVAPD